VAIYLNLKLSVLKQKPLIGVSKKTILLYTMTKKMYKISKPGTLLALGLLLLAGCYPKGPEYYSDTDLTVTDYDLEYNFGDQKKYWMADTVEYITNIDNSELDQEDVDALLSQIASNLEKAGYEAVGLANPDEADFVITVSVIASKNTSVGWVPGPPCYPGWGWGCGWGGYYPPYWGGYYSYSYTTGSVITNWWDPDTPAPAAAADDEQPIHWVATFNGLLSSSSANNKDRVIFSVDQAFKQSPYIKSNK